MKKTYREIAEDKAFGLLGEMKDWRLSNFIHFVLTQVKDEFFTAPGSRAQHHDFRGGLGYHSACAAELGKKIANHYNEIGIKVDTDLVIAGILLHDIGKMKCYRWDEEKEVEDKEGNITKGAYAHTAVGTMFHHIPIGFELVARLGREYNDMMYEQNAHIEQERLDQLLHIILSHHGRRSWSSPVIPQFMEAYIVHAVEMMDGYVDKFNDGKKVSTIYDGVTY